MLYLSLFINFYCWQLLGNVGFVVAAKSEIYPEDFFVAVFCMSRNLYISSSNVFQCTKISPLCTWIEIFLSCIILLKSKFHYCLGKKQTNKQKNRNFSSSIIKKISFLDWNFQCTVSGYKFLSPAEKCLKDCHWHWFAVFQFC